MSATDQVKIDKILTEAFDAFQNVPRPKALISCDCGSCFSSKEAANLLAQKTEDMDYDLLSKCFMDYSVMQDKVGLHYLMPAFMKTVLESTFRGHYRFDFYTWRFGRLLQEIGIKNWPASQQEIIWNWLEAVLDLLLTAGRLKDFDDWVVSLMRPGFDWVRYTSLLKQPRHNNAKLGFIAYFLPWENGYENPPKGFELSFSEVDSLNEKHKEAYYDWMIMNLSSASPLSKTIKEE